MTKKIDGIIDRCGPSLVGHGDHGFEVLLVGSNIIYWLPGARVAYATIHGRPSSSNDSLVSLTRDGDHVSFEAEGIRGRDGTLRNWTLEARLLVNPERDVTPAAAAIAEGGKIPSLPGTANG